MEITARVTIGPSIYSHLVEKKVTVEVENTDVLNPQQMRAHLKIAEENMKKLIRNFDSVEAAEKIRIAQENTRLKAQLKSEMDLENKAKYELISEIAELKKEVKKRDCRLDGIIASRNPEYAPPDEDGDPQTLD